MEEKDWKEQETGYGEENMGTEQQKEEKHYQTNSHREKRKPERSAGNLIFGVVLIIVGIISLLEQFHIIDNNILQYALTMWPLILIGWGLTVLIKGKSGTKAIIWVIVILIMLGYGFLKSLDHGRINIEDTYADNSGEVMTEIVREI